MSSPVKIERLNRAIALTISAGASSVPGAVPGSTTEVEVDIGEFVPLHAAVSVGYIGSTAAARMVNHMPVAYIKHSDATKLVFKWFQLTAAAAAVPAGTYTFLITW